MNLDPDVRVCLSWNSSGFNKAASFLIHIVATLSCWNIVANIGIQPLLPATHGLIVELTTLLLKLIVTHIKRVASQAMVAHPHLVLLPIQVINNLIIVLVIIVDSCSVDIGCNLNIIVGWLADVQAVVSLVVPISIRCVVLICIQMLRVATWMLLWWLSSNTATSSIVVEHSQRVVLAIPWTHLYLSWVLESQVFLPLPLTVLAKCSWITSHQVRLLLIIIMMWIGTVFCIRLLLLKGKLRRGLINVWVCWLVLGLKIFVVWWVDIEMLSGVQWATLITLVCLGKLLLRRHVEITLGDGKLFHVALRIHILNALVNVIYRSRVLLILRCWQILKLSECMLLVYYCITYKILARSRWTSVVRLVLVNTLLLTFFKWLLVLVFKDPIWLSTLEVI